MKIIVLILILGGCSNAVERADEVKPPVEPGKELKWNKSWNDNNWQ